MENVNEWAFYAGQDQTDRAWLLHPGDVWVSNPHYHGPKMPSPEEDWGE